MNQTVAHTDNILPGNAWHFSPCALGNLIGCLTDDLNRLDQSEYQESIAVEILAASFLNKRDGLASPIERMLYRMRSSLRILPLGLTQNVLTEIPAQILGGAQIDLASAK